MNRVKKAYTLLEILIVITIILVIAGTHYVPNALRLRMIAEETVCEENRRLLRDAVLNYESSNNADPASFHDLVDQAFVSAVPDCPSGGTYSWAIDADDKSKLDKRKVVCSIHGVYPEDVEE